MTSEEKLQRLIEYGAKPGSPSFINNCVDCAYDYHFGGDAWAYGQTCCPNPECEYHTVGWGAE